MIDPRFYTLLAHLWRGGKCGYFWTPNIDGEKISYWLTVDPMAAPLVPKMFLDKDAYFSVNPATMRRSEHERARNSDIAALNCFYCEFDDTDRAKLDAFLAKLAGHGIEAACVVFSGGGYHVYVLLRDTFHLDTLDKINRAMELQWAFAQFAGGDTSVNDLARVLRIPGTINHKPEYSPNFPIVNIIQWDMGALNDLGQIEPLLQPLIDARNSKIYAIPPKIQTTLTVKDDRLIAALFRSKNGTDYQQLWNGDLSVCGGDHSKCDQYLCDGLAWVTGRDVARMDQLFRQSGLMRDKWNRDDYRKLTLENAANSAYMDYDPFRGIDPDAIAAVEAMLNNE
jgi:hypothetical protein